MRDTCICPGCQEELEVDGLYGDNLKCGKCGCKISVFPDDLIYLSTPFGTFGVGFPDKNLLMKLLLGKFTARLSAGEEGERR